MFHGPRDQRGSAFLIRDDIHFVLYHSVAFTNQRSNLFAAQINRPSRIEMK